MSDYPQEMPDKPSADTRIDESLVRELLTQASIVPDAVRVPLRHVADGWDCSVWRVGEDLAARLPRRAAAAGLVHHEARALPFIGAAIEATGVRVARPLFIGEPTHAYPWSWTIVPWIGGRPGLDVPRIDRDGWALPLAHALSALHAPAPVDHPVNPFRGVPLADRADTVRDRIDALRAAGGLTPPTLARAEDVWSRGVDAPPWSSDPVWIHGDLHPGNLIAEGHALRGIIDFGDVTGGDPAYDLAVAWLAFGASGRAAFIGATGDRYDAATWTRARAWAAAVAVMLLAHSDDDPLYGTLGTESLHEVSAIAEP